MDRLTPDRRPTSADLRKMRLHSAAVLPAYLVQGIGYLPERAMPHRAHDHFEDVAVPDHGLTQALQRVLDRSAGARVAVSGQSQVCLLYTSPSPRD